jgi:hypothetical protein
MACAGGAPSIQDEDRGGALRFDVRDEATGRLVPCKLTILGLDGTPEPRLGGAAAGVERERLTLSTNRILAGACSGAVTIPAGRYEVQVSRGPEWDVSVERVEITPRGADLVARLSRVVRTDGWLSADLHVHADPSADSRVPPHSRARQLAAEGVDLLVSMDHDAVTDYAPVVDELGLGAELATVRGVEILTDAWGHFGVFPLPEDSDVRERVESLGRAVLEPAALLAEIRRLVPDAFVAVHHPRLDDIGYFARAGFDPVVDAARPGFAYGFDGVEVLNGAANVDADAVARALRDWFALLARGHVVVATGGSDAHRLGPNTVGYPRTYARVGRPAASPAARADQFLRALQRGEAFVTTGPFIEAWVDGKGIGETVSVAAPEFELELEVRAAPWVDVRRVIVYVGGEPGPELSVAEGAEPVRVRTRLALRATVDTHLVVEVRGTRALAPVVGAPGRNAVRPLAITNPIFIDADGNGRFDAPLARGTNARPPGR